VTARQKA